MKIGIIGAGNIGAALTRIFVAEGHDVSIANSRGPESLEELALETGARATDVDDVSAGVEVVVVTIPMRSVPDLPAGFLDGAVDGVVVIDTCNYYPQRDGRIEAIEAGTTESRWVSEQIAYPVVKAFNTIQAQHLLDLGRPKGDPGRVALPVSGDDGRAKAIVMDLIDEIGFDPVDAGNLDNSWRQQPGSPVYGKDFDAEKTRSAIAEATPQAAR